MPVQILIVDDNSSIRNLLRQHFETQTGWRVCGEAANGKEGIEKAQALSPDLIILDLSMPVLNGLEAARILNRQMPHVAIVMFTSFTTPVLEDELLGAGVHRIVSKSASLSELTECARSLLKEAA